MMRSNFILGNCGSRRIALLMGASALALAGSAAAEAQTAPAAAESDSTAEVVVTGIRASLGNAQSIKRNAATVVDAVSAADIGALPDRSVTESLQRIPGVDITRFEASNDPDHFSVEGTNPTIRGLNLVRTELNGRDNFSIGNAGNSRTLDLSGFPSELLGSIQVFKGTTADLIEGGLAGTVDLVTRKPFDRKGFHVAFDGEANYSDFIKKTTPVGSILVSDTWNTGIGTFGLQADVSYSETKFRSDAMKVTNIQTRDGATLPNGAVRQQLPGKDVAYAPIGANFGIQDTDRKRFGIDVVGQWESSDHRMLLTGEFLRSHATRAWTEHNFETESGSSEYNTFPAGCLPTAGPANCPAGFADYQYSSDNVFENGTITLPGSGWRTFDSGSPTTRVTTGGMQQNLDRRDRMERTTTSDYSLNLKWSPTSRLHVNLDGQYIKATANNFDVTTYADTFADEKLDLTGSTPQAVLLKPLNGSNVNPIVAGQSDAQYFSDPANYYWRAAMDHMDQSSGDEWAFKGDVTYDLNETSPFLDNIKVGGRYSDRNQTLKYTSYNWGYVSEIWDGTGPAVFLDKGPQGHTGFYDFDNFFRGKVNKPVGGFYFDQNQLDNYGTVSQVFKQIEDQWVSSGGFAGGWTPVAERAGVIPGTPYFAGDITVSGEKTKAAYAMLTFGQSQSLLGPLHIQGNIGIRYVETEEKSVGSISYPNAGPLGGGYNVICNPPGGGAVPGICGLGPQFFANLVTFSDSGAQASTVSTKTHSWLPSLNLRADITDKLLIRVALAKSLARPEFGYLNNYVSLAASTGDVPVTGTAGNPYLKPATSKQMDIGAEWYFSRVGSLTGTFFYKRIHDFFYQGAFNRDFTHNGVTETATITGPANYDGTGTVKGFEIGYQQTFDFLPGILSGLGAAANYTYVKSKGVPNAFLAGNSQPSTGRGNLPLEGVSKNTYNLTGFYEKGPLSLRVAYNYRSRFLLTAVDEIYPYFPVYNASSGQLDASIFYSVNKFLKVGVQGVNLTDTVTRTLQQYTASGKLGPRASFINDRRYAFIVRGNF